VVWAKILLLILQHVPVSPEMTFQLLASGFLDLAFEKTGCVHVVELDNGGHRDELHDDVHEVVERSEIYDDHNFDNDGDCALEEAQEEWGEDVSIPHRAVWLLNAFEALWVVNGIFH